MHSAWSSKVPGISLIQGNNVNYLFISGYSKRLLFHEDLNVTLVARGLLHAPDVADCPLTVRTNISTPHSWKKTDKRKTQLS